ncbi:MAG: tetratricopeptide repeat protein [Candidatus Hydrogenedentes bacterium]|nr:tetratricopeptide repeat protein [Candidatus Hydrogenedentota bacterium]
MAMIGESGFRFLVCLAVVSAAFVAYVNTFPGDFVWDDVSSVLLHEDVTNGRLTELFTKDQHAYGRGQGNFYRPLVSTSFLVDFALSKAGDPTPAPSPEEVPRVSPFFFHITNVLWHAAAALAFFLVLARLGAPRFVQAAVPLLYVVHPLHTEAVAYISGRADPMAAAFGFAGLFFALGSGRRWMGAVLCWVCFALALLCKESATIFPFVLLALVIGMWVKRKAGETEAAPASTPPYAALIGSFALVVVYGILRMTVLRFSDETSANTSGLLTRTVESMQSLAVYVKLIVAPTNLHMERTLAEVPGWAALAGLLVVAVILAVAVWALKTGRTRLWFGAALFLITWIPISGIFPLNAPLAEHWMYVPLAGFLTVVFELFAPVGRNAALRTALAFAIFLAGTFFLLQTVTRNRDWRSNESIYLATLEDNPNSIRVNYNLAVTYEDLSGNIAGARRYYNRVVALYADKKAKDATLADTYWEDELESHVSLGRIYFEQQRYQPAAEHFGTVLRVEPNEQTRQAVGTAFLGMAETLAAVRQFDNLRTMLESGRAKFPELQQQIDTMLQALPPATSGAAPGQS